MIKLYFVAKKKGYTNLAIKRMEIELARRQDELNLVKFIAADNMSSTRLIDILTRMLNFQAGTRYSSTTLDILPEYPDEPIDVTVSRNALNTADEESRTATPKQKTKKMKYRSMCIYDYLTALSAYKLILLDKCIFEESPESCELRALYHAEANRASYHEKARNRQAVVGDKYIAREIEKDPTFKAKRREKHNKRNAKKILGKAGESTIDIYEDLRDRIQGLEHNDVDVNSRDGWEDSEEYHTISNILDNMDDSDEESWKIATQNILNMEGPSKVQRAKNDAKQRRVKEP